MWANFSTSKCAPFIECSLPRVKVKGNKMETTGVGKIWTHVMLFDQPEGGRCVQVLFLHQQLMVQLGEPLTVNIPPDCGDEVWEQHNLHNDIKRQMLDVLLTSPLKAADPEYVELSKLLPPWVPYPNVPHSQ